MSIVLLFHYSVQGGEWSPLAQEAIAYWENFLRILFDRIMKLTSFINWILGILYAYFGSSDPPLLYPHWKHVFVLLMTTYGSYVKVYSMSGGIYLQVMHL